jgi:hypothetical protein
MGCCESRDEASPISRTQTIDEIIDMNYPINNEMIRVSKHTCDPGELGRRYPLILLARDFRKVQADFNYCRANSHHLGRASAQKYFKNYCRWIRNAKQNYVTVRTARIKARQRRASAAAAPSKVQNAVS